MIDNKGNDLGDMYGSARETKKSNATILFRKNTILFTNDKFFKRGSFKLFFACLKKVVLFFFT